jgi:hypothetical protein
MLLRTPAAGPNIAATHLQEGETVHPKVPTFVSAPLPSVQFFVSRDTPHRRVKQICCKSFIASHLRLRRVIQKKCIMKHG